MAGELLKNLTGIDIVHVPYKGSTGARTDILSGQIQMLFDSVPTMAPMIKAGMVRALGTSGAETLADPARRADARRSRRARLSGHTLGRLHGADRNAAADRRPAQSRDHQDRAAAGHQSGMGETGRHAADDDASRNSRPSCKAQIEKWAKIIKRQPHPAYQLSRHILSFESR